MNRFIKALFAIFMMAGLVPQNVSGQTIDTIYENSFERSNQFIQGQSQCNYDLTRTSDSASEGNYSVRFRSSLAPLGCVARGFTRSFNIANIKPNDTFLLSLDFYKSSPVSNQDDFVQLLMAPENGDNPALVNLFRNTQKGAQTSPGWNSLFLPIPGQQILDSTSSNTFGFVFFAVSGGNGADMAFDNIKLVRFSYDQAFISLQQPNGGELLEQTQSYPIRWSASDNLGNVDIAYSSDNGNSWNTIQTGVDAAQGSYNWTVPSITTQDALVRVRSSNDPSVSSISSSTFTIKEPNPTIEVTDPSSFTNLEIATRYSIEWNSLKTQKVDIEYSTNAGRNWATIANDVNAAKGTYEWIVPNSPSNNAVLRILNASDRSYGDTVENLEITSGRFPVITLKRPSENDSIRTNTSYNIEWVANNQVSQVDIEFSETDGNTWNTVASDVDGNDGSYEWTTPSDPVDPARIRVVDANDPSIVSQSGPFSILGEIRQLSMIQPAVGDTVEGGSTYTVKWTASQDVSDLLIELSEDGGNTWNEVESGYNAQDESYDWNVPGETVEEAVLRITDEQATNVKAKTGTFYIDGVSGIKSANKSETLSVYPNPVEAQLRVTVPEALDGQRITLALLSSDGRQIRVKQNVGHQDQITLNVDNLTKGMYLIRMQGSQEQFIGKFTKQ